MDELIPCPNQGCRGGKVHFLVGFDIFWDDCPTCNGLGSVKRAVPDNIEGKAES
jgi:hypothetical protein